MRAPSLIVLLLALGCTKGAIVLDDTGDGPGVEDDACPVLSLGATELQWAGVSVGQASTQSLTALNDCEGVASLELVAAVEGSTTFSIVEGTLSLSPGASGDLVVAFTAPDEELYEGVLRVTSTDGQTGEVALKASASSDFDQDGYLAPGAGGDDCDDFDAAVNPGAAETWYDGVDADCSGGSDYDQDGDGQDATVGAGEDCDDLNAEIYTGAPETWYDGVDQDCSGGSDYDQDGDGADALVGGGEDCDDTNPEVGPGKEEVPDAFDNDCSGLADDTLITAGDAFFTELLVNPRAVDDSVGEYIEVLNNSGRALNLKGFTLSSTKGGSFTLDADLILPIGGYAVLGASSDTTTNGGAAVDWSWAGSGFTLADGGDTLTLTGGSVTVFTLAYTTSWPISAGAAANLDDTFLTLTDAADVTRWCAASSSLSGGDKGSPGALNDNCTSVDHDGDGYSVDAGDCDDDDDAVGPDADEVWDGIDNDCDGSVDVVPVIDVAGGYLTGQDSDSWLGFHTALGVGDITGDGVVDLATGAIYRGSSSEGTLYVVSGADYTTWAGSVSTYADYTYAGDEREYLGHVPQSFGDVNGDGKADLAWSATDAYYGYYYGSNAGGVVFSGSLSSADAGDGASVEFEGAETYMQNGYDGPTYHTMIINHLDLDADGYTEVVYGDPAYGGNDYNGAVYGFDGAGLASGDDLDLTDSELLLDGDDDDYLGAWLGGGDLNGDGYDDLAMGAPGNSDARTDAGAIYIWSGASSLNVDSTVSSGAKTVIQGAGRDERLGRRGGVALGDFDNDGKTDLAVASPYEETVYLFWDTATSITGTLSVTDADLTIESGGGPSYFGHGLSVGDYTGDGVDDLAIGAPDGVSYTYGEANTVGQVYVYNGDSLAAAGASLTEEDADGGLQGENSVDFFGATLATGDFNSDGVDDLAVTAHGYGSTSSSVGYGRIYVIDW